MGAPRATAEEIHRAPAASRESEDFARGHAAATGGSGPDDFERLLKDLGR